MPEINAGEASLIKGLNIYPVKSLIEVFNHLTGREKIKKFDKKVSFEVENIGDLDMKYVKGQQQAKRALEIVVASFLSLQVMYTSNICLNQATSHI